MKNKYIRKSINADHGNIYYIIDNTFIAHIPISLINKKSIVYIRNIGLSNRYGFYIRKYIDDK